MSQRQPAFLIASTLALLCLSSHLAEAAGESLVQILPCRAIDTRDPAGPLGGPALAANQTRIFTLTGTCGVPSNALGLAVNLTVVAPAGTGFAKLYAGDAGEPNASVLSFSAGQTRANNALVALATNASGTVAITNASTGNADFVIDVVGYFTSSCPATLTVTNPSTTTATVGTAFSQTFTQTGGVGTTTFSTTSPLPGGMTLATNGTLSGTPTQTGSFPIVVTARDADDCTGIGTTYMLVVGCQTITIHFPTDATLDWFIPFTQTFTQTGAIGTATFSVSSGSTPPGTTLAANGTFSGDPSMTGSFPFTILVTDSTGCTATLNYIAAVRCISQVFTFSPSGLPPVANGAAFPPTTFTATGGNPPPSLYGLSGTLPAGMTFAVDTLSGMPTQTGVFPIRIVAQDSFMLCADGRDYLVVVTCPGTTLVVSPGSVPSGVRNTAYAPVTFGASGGTGPYTFTEAGSLPIGMTFSSGTLSGTPIRSGTYPFTVAVSDSTTGCTGLRSYSITVNDPPSMTSAPGRR